MASAHIAANCQRKITQVNADLATFTAQDYSSSGIQGQLTVDLNSILKWVMELEDLAKREFQTVKREKLLAKSQELRIEYSDLKRQFEQIKVQKERNELVGNHSTKSSNLFTQDASSSDMSRFNMDHLMKEGERLNNSNSKVDGLINMGREAIKELQSQRDTLKGARKRMLDVANYLGLSSSVIKLIEKRSAEDKWILWGGICFTILCFWAIIHFLT